MNAEIGLNDGVATVIKIGGSTYQDRAVTLEDIALLHKAGKKLVVVHGGGKEIDKALEEAQINTSKIDGIRVTPPEALEVVVGVLKKINGDIVDHLAHLGVLSYGFLPEDKLLKSVLEKPELGLVGKTPDVAKSQLAILKRYLFEGVMPVVCPIAVQKNKPGQTLNVNADTSAGAIATALVTAALPKPEPDFVLLTDQPGVMDQKGLLIPEITPNYYHVLKQLGIVKGGMLPKIEACLSVVQKGGSALIFGGPMKEAFSPTSNGTTIKTSFSSNYGDKLVASLIQQLGVPSDRTGVYTKSLYLGLGSEHQPDRAIGYLTFKLSQRSGVF